LPSTSGCILSSPYLRPTTPLSRPWAAFARVANRIAPWIQVRTGLTANMMSSDPAMCEQAKQDALLVHCATPRWYTGMIEAQKQTLAAAGQFRLPLLCLIGQADPVADPAAMERFVEAAGSKDKVVVRYPGKLHELLRETGREQIFQTILEWMRARADQNA
jgi:alpha-beta hydrolase superfamily lysophospholipase